MSPRLIGANSNQRSRCGGPARRAGRCNPLLARAFRATSSRFSTGPLCSSPLRASAPGTVLCLSLFRLVEVSSSPPGSRCGARRPTSSRISACRWLTSVHPFAACRLSPDEGQLVGSTISLPLHHASSTSSRSPIKGCGSTPIPSRHRPRAIDAHSPRCLLCSPGLYAPRNAAALHLFLRRAQFPVRTAGSFPAIDGRLRDP